MAAANDGKALVVVDVTEWRARRYPPIWCPRVEPRGAQLLIESGPQNTEGL